MKILLISSSPHKEKSMSIALANKVLKPLSGKNTEIEVIHLANLIINFCRHCEACHQRILWCPIKDDAPKVINKMLEADGIIFATPNYINHITASMKALFERASHFIHCKRLLGKYVAATVSSGSRENKQVLDYIRYYAHTCGAQYSGGISACAITIGEKTDAAKRLGKKLLLDIQAKKIFPEQTKIIEAGKTHFQRIIKMRKGDWKQEYQYWQANCWL